MCILNIAGMLVDGLTIEDISGGGHGDTTPPKILKRKQEEKEEEKEKEKREKETEAAKRIRRRGEGRERRRGTKGRHIENVSITITSLVYVAVPDSLIRASWTHRIFMRLHSTYEPHP